MASVYKSCLHYKEINMYPKIPITMTRTCLTVVQAPTMMVAERAAEWILQDSMEGAGAVAGGPPGVKNEL